MRQGDRSMLPNGTITEVTRLAGDLPVSETAAALEQSTETLVVADGDAYWVLTGDELRERLEGWGTSSLVLADLLSHHYGHAVVRSASLPFLEELCTGTRSVITEGSEVVGVVIDAPLARPGSPATDVAGPDGFREGPAEDDPDGDLEYDEDAVELDSEADAPDRIVLPQPEPPAPLPEPQPPAPPPEPQPPAAPPEPQPEARKRWHPRLRRRRARRRSARSAPRRGAPPAGEAPGGTAAAAPAGEEAEERWYLQTQFPREVTVGSTTSLLVSLDQEADDGPDRSTLAVTLAEGAEVGVVIQAKEGFEIEGPAEGSLATTTDSLPLRFQLRATTEGTGTVRVLFFVEATALGAITLKPAILPPEEWAADAPVPSSEVVSALSVGAARPDLELVVLEEASSSRPTYSIRITAADEALGIHLQEFGPVELHTDARRYFTELFADIEGLDLFSEEDQQQAQGRLRSKGNHLFSTLLPVQLQEKLWEIRDRIVRVRIDSEEPHIPWELIRLSGPDEDGSVVEGRFLCEYELTRWIPGIGLHSRLTLADFGVVIPDDSGLEHAEEERSFLAGLAGPEREVTQVPPAFDALMDALAAGRHDVWHFSGHGSVRDDQDPNRAVMELADSQRFTPEQISGAQTNLGRVRPLVFLNGCRIGRAGISLTGLGGWAARFLEAGAAGFVGAMWNVHDKPARDFSRTFYTRLLEGDTLGAATLQAREGIRQYGDATWLAYTVYGHPSAARSTEGG